MRQTPNTKLAKIAKLLLDPHTRAEECKHALDRFALLCSQATLIEPDPSLNAWANDIFLSQGMAINPSAAAQCVKDYQRSVQFMRGIFEAINDLIYKKPLPESVQEKHIIYAGCGPYATLLLPLLSVLPNTGIKIYLLDIHEDSLASVRKLITFFELDHWSLNLVQADACRYQHTREFDLVITETMQKALEQEPQLAVSANLGKQLKDTGALIPECIQVDLVIATQQVALLSLTKDSAIELMKNASSSACGEKDPNKLFANLTSIKLEPTIDDATHKQAELLTRIQVYKHHRLEHGDCDLTLSSPCDLSHIKNIRQCDNKESIVINVHYALGVYPRFVFS